MRPAEGSTSANSVRGRGQSPALRGPAGNLALAAIDERLLDRLEALAVRGDDADARDELRRWIDDAVVRRAHRARLVSDLRGRDDADCRTLVLELRTIHEVLDRLDGDFERALAAGDDAALRFTAGEIAFRGRGHAFLVQALVLPLLAART
ncbi:MAG: hypothetical protein R3F20_13255 [Planctomycetota bacterium]